MGDASSELRAETIREMLGEMQKVAGDASKCERCVFPERPELAHVCDYFLSTKNVKQNLQELLSSADGQLSEFLTAFFQRAASVKRGIKDFTNSQDTESQALDSFCELIFGGDTVASLAFVHKKASDGDENTGTVPVMLLASNDGFHGSRRFIFEVGARIKEHEQNQCDCSKFGNEREQHAKASWTVEPFCRILYVFSQCESESSGVRVLVGPFNAKVSPSEFKLTICQTADGRRISETTPGEIQVTVVRQLLRSQDCLAGPEHDQLLEWAKAVGLETLEEVLLPIDVFLLNGGGACFGPEFCEIGHETLSAPKMLYYDGLCSAVQSLSLILGCAVSGQSGASQEAVTLSCKQLLDCTILAQLQNASTKSKCKLSGKEFQKQLKKRKVELYDLAKKCFTVTVQECNGGKKARIDYSRTELPNYLTEGPKKEITNSATDFCNSFNSLMDYVSGTGSSQSTLRNWLSLPIPNRAVSMADGCRKMHAELRILHGLIDGKYDFSQVEINISKHVCLNCATALLHQGFRKLRLPQMECTPFPSWTVPCYIVSRQSERRAFLGEEAFAIYEALPETIQVSMAGKTEEIDCKKLALLLICQLQMTPQGQILSNPDNSKPSTSPKESAE